MMWRAMWAFFLKKIIEGMTSSPDTLPGKALPPAAEPETLKGEQVKSREEIIQEVAKFLRVSNWRWLYNLINFETAGTFSPVIKNPNSSARGLIQFLDSTARNLGFSSSLDLVTKYPSFESQIWGPVVQYLKPFAPFPTEQSLYMAVFRPANRNSSLDTLFPEAVRKANPGINTVGDYVSKINRQKGALKAGGEVLGTLLLTGAALYLFSKVKGV